MVKPFVSINTGNIKAQIAAVNKNLDASEEAATAATRQALTEIANDMLAKAQAKVAVMSGDLQGSGTVLDPVITSDEVSVRWGFNKEYARMRDQGGDIVPTKARLLAIPLDPIMTATGPRFASPREEANLELVPILEWLFLADKDSGEFHWILVPHVHQEGSQYVSGTVLEEAPRVAPTVAQRVGELLSAGGVK